MIDCVGWVGTVVFMVASVLIAHKKVSGMWLLLLGNFLFGIVGWLSGLSSVLGVSIIMGLFDFYGIYKWRDE